MKNSLILYLGLYLILLMACYEDKGNYDLKDYNKITITEVSSLTKTTVVFGDTIRIVPKITWKYPDRDTTENEWEFRWEVEDEVVSTERNLVYVPNKFGTLVCQLFVTEKNTNVVTIRTTSTLNVESPYKTGWLLLTEKDGRPALNFVRREQYTDENKVVHYSWVNFKDFYAEMYPNKPLPADVFSATVYTTDSYADETLLLDAAGDGWILDGNSFELKMLLREEFPSGYPDGFKPIAFWRGGGSDFVLGSNGQVCWRRNSAQSQLFHVDAFMDEPVYFSGGSNAKFFLPIHPSKCSFMWMYDELNNRIIGCYCSYSSGNNYHGGKLTITNNQPSNVLIDINDFGDDYEFVWLGDHSSLSFNNILKEKSTGKYILQEFSVTASTTTITVKDPVDNQPLRRDFEGGEFITDKTVFWRMRTSAYLYFGTGGKLYFYDINTRKVKLYKDFGSDNITHLREDADSKLLGVGLDNGSFWLFDPISAEVLSDNNPGEKGFRYKVENLGRILSLEWKYGGYYNLVFDRYQ